MAIVIAYIPDITARIYPSFQTSVPVFIHLTGAVCGLLGIYVIKYIGRKSLLQLGSLSCAIFHVIIGWNFMAKAAGLGSDIGNFLILAGLFLFRGMMAFSLGPVVWLYIPEVV